MFIKNICFIFFFIMCAVVAKAETFYDFTPNDISGNPHPLSQYKGKVVMVVNTASQCGFTPQLKDLQQLYKEFKDKGFVILAFPSNDFKQEVAENNQVSEFAKKEYGVEFPLMEKAPVSGAKKQPVFKFLIEAKPGFLFSEVKWNFEKFLISRDGKVLDRWNSMTSPMGNSIHSAVEKAINGN